MKGGLIMSINIWWALFFMFLGGAIVDMYNWRAWKLYQRGKNERFGCNEGMRR